MGGIPPRAPAQRPQSHRYFFSEVFLQGQEVGGIEGGLDTWKQPWGTVIAGRAHLPLGHPQSSLLVVSVSVHCFTSTPGFPFTEAHGDPAPESRLPGQPVLKAGLPASLAATSVPPTERDRLLPTKAAPPPPVHAEPEKAEWTGLAASDSREALLMPSPSGTPCPDLPTGKRTMASWCCFCHQPSITFIILWSLF